MLCRRCLRLVIGRRAVGPRPPSLASTSFSTPALPRPFSSYAPISSRSGVFRLSNSPTSNAISPLVGSRTYSTSTADSNAAQTESPGRGALLEKPDSLNDAESLIWDKLVAALEPTELIVQDISGGCGSMYGIEISSEKFRGANMLKQQRMVNAALGDLVKSWHGVQLKTRVPYVAICLVLL